MTEFENQIEQALAGRIYLADQRYFKDAVTYHQFIADIKEIADKCDTTISDDFAQTAWNISDKILTQDKPYLDKNGQMSYFSTERKRRESLTPQQVAAIALKAAQWHKADEFMHFAEEFSQPGTARRSWKDFQGKFGNRDWFPKSDNQ
jgi:hypothetical protein